jgi:acetylglutamate kinase
MIDKYIEKAKILQEALPYIQNFAGKTIVIKYGGSIMENVELQQSIAKDIVLLKFVGINPVIVHGGGKEISSWLKKVNIENEFIQGIRKTSLEAMEVIEMVLTGKINKSIVGMLNNSGGKALGLSGKDAKMVMGETIDQESLGFAGNISTVEPNILLISSEHGYIPVISSIAINKKNQTLNINADIFAAEIAKSLKAEKLIFLSDVDGINDKKNLIKQIFIDEVINLIDKEIITAGMIPKINSCVDAINHGVTNVHIINGTTPHSILLELFTDYGIGTMIKKKG